MSQRRTTATAKMLTCRVPARNPSTPLLPVQGRYWRACEQRAEDGSVPIQYMISLQKESQWSSRMTSSENNVPLPASPLADARAGLQDLSLAADTGYFAIRGEGSPDQSHLETTYRPSTGLPTSLKPPVDPVSFKFDLRLLRW